MLTTTRVNSIEQNRGVWKKINLRKTFSPHLVGIMALQTEKWQFSVISQDNSTKTTLNMEQWLLHDELKARVPSTEESVSVPGPSSPLCAVLNCQSQRETRRERQRQRDRVRGTGCTSGPPGNSQLLCLSISIFQPKGAFLTAL